MQVTDLIDTPRDAVVEDLPPSAKYVVFVLEGEDGPVTRCKLQERTDVAARETAGSACSRARRCRPVGSDVDNLDRPNARDPSATARRERAYKFGQAQRARGVQLFGHSSSTVLRDAEAPPCTLSTDKPMDGGSDQFLETRIQRIRHSRTPYRKNLVAGE